MAVRLSFFLYSGDSFNANAKSIGNYEDFALFCQPSKSKK